MLFDNLSPKTDFSSKITTKLDTLNKNVLYITHECDKIKNLIDSIIVNLDVYQQTLDYYAKQTPPQTDSGEQTSD